MRITSLAFCFFVIICVLCYWKSKIDNRKYIILLSNIIFYISYGWGFVFILFFSVTVSYFGALFIDKNRRPIRLATVLLFVLLPLIFFKYSIFALRFIGPIFEYDSSSLRIIAPLGISYYTFQAISYLVDVYKEKIQPEKDFYNYSVYMSFFPTVTSGPIQRSNHFFSRLKSVSAFNEEMFIVGCQRIVLGLFKKCVIADRISAIIDPVLKDVYSYDGFTLVLVMIGYTIMLYCDFSGYSDIAIGIAKMYGIEVLENFKYPYFAISINDFWDRWHISLSSWLREYIYIPLGGSKKGTLRTYINIFITFFISGIWHGAGFKFLIWGSIHGILRCFERLTGLDKHKKIEEWSQFSKKEKCGYSFRNIIMFFIIAFTWIPFALPTTRGFIYYLTHALSFGTNVKMYISNGIKWITINRYSLTIVLVGICILFIFEFSICKDNENITRVLNKKCVVALLLILLLGFNYAGESTFIYGAF